MADPQPQFRYIVHLGPEHPNHHFTDTPLGARAYVQEWADELKRPVAYWTGGQPTLWAHPAR